MNKPTLIADLIIDQNIDFLGLTETWLKKADLPQSRTVSEMTPTGYSCVHVPRSRGKGGGVGIIHKASLSVKKMPHRVFRTVENLHVSLKAGHSHLNVYVIYRPPPNTKNKLTADAFFDEMSLLLEDTLQESGHLVIMGDFNFHWDKVENRHTTRLRDILESSGTIQHVESHTHRHSHLLDLVITRASEDSVRSFHVDDPGLSDHSAVYFRMSGKTPSPVRKHIQYRPFRSIDMDSFAEDLSASDLIQKPATSLTDRVKQYNTVLGDLLDKHAPVKNKTITVRPYTEWYTPDIRAAKIERRRPERKWRKSKLTIDYDLFAAQSSGDACQIRVLLREGVCIRVGPEGLISDRQKSVT